MYDDLDKTLPLLTDVLNSPTDMVVFVNVASMGSTTPVASVLHTTTALILITGSLKHTRLMYSRYLGWDKL